MSGIGGQGGILDFKTYLDISGVGGHIGHEGDDVSLCSEHGHGLLQSEHLGAGAEENPSLGLFI